MVDFIVDNYLLILIIAIFLIFALIGYVIDSTKHKKNKEAEILTEKDDIIIDEIQNAPVIEEVSLPEENNEDMPTVNEKEELKIPEIDENN